MKKIQLTLFLSCLLLMGCGTSEKKSVAIVPQPQSCDVQAGSYTFAAGGAFSSNLSGSELDDLSAVLASSPFRLTVSEDAGDKTVDFIRLQDPEGVQARLKVVDLVRV